MSKLLELKQNDSCILWLESLKSKSTINAYSIYLSLFCKFHGVTPDQLLKLNNSEVRTLVLNYIVHLKRMAKQAAGKPKRGELSVNSVKHYTYSASRRFV
jgi:hypothetical protein